MIKYNINPAWARRDRQRAYPAVCDKEIFTMAIFSLNIAEFQSATKSAVNSSNIYSQKGVTEGHCHLGTNM